MGLITKKIQQIKALITERGSQTKIMLLQETLLQTKSEILSIHEELMGLLQEDDEQFGDEWTEEINFEVDDCCSDVNDYLISRKDDRPSEIMSKASIVDEYLKGSVYDESLTEGISDLADQLNKMSIKIDQNSEKQDMSKELFQRKRHTKAELGERLESIALKSGFNQEINLGSNQPQIHNFMNGNREPTATGKEEEKENIYILSNTSGGIPRQEGNTKKRDDLDKAHHYPERIEYEDIDKYL